MADKEIERKSVFWNMTFSMLQALQSAVMIMVITRIIGAEEAGMVSIAYAMAYLMYTIGVYGVRDFHATDSQRRYSYGEYRKLRMISCSVMLLGSIVYCMVKAYEPDKTIIILLICILKLEEAVEDLYHGEFQREGRLDLAGKLGTVRLSLAYIVFILIIICSQNIVLAIGVMIIVSLVMIIITRELLKISIQQNRVKKIQKPSLLKLALLCFPLFVMLFLSIYINNAPKYAIDTYLSEEDQAYYAIISMPVFTINLLSGIVYRPQLLYMAELWNTGKKNEFRKLIWKQVANITVISIMITIMGIVIGFKILQVLYGVSLGSLKMEFVILLLGGGIVSIYNFFCACLTIIRSQVFMLGIAVLVMLLSAGISSPFVQQAGLTGASCLYFILMMAELVLVSFVLFVCLHMKSEKVDTDIV